MSLQQEYDLTNETAQRLLGENCGLDPVSMQAHIAQHLTERGDSLDEETQMILRACMVGLNVMHRQLEAMAAMLGLPPYRAEVTGGQQ
jgi:hypothetical protein